MSNEMWSIVGYKWRDGNILFRYKFGPYSDEISKEIESGSDSIWIKFVDIDYFDIIEKKILLSSCIEVFGDNQRPAYWSYEGEISCGKDNFNEISYYTHSWIFNDKLIQGIATFDKKLQEERKTVEEAKKEIENSQKEKPKVQTTTSS